MNNSNYFVCFYPNLCKSYTQITNLPSNKCIYYDTVYYTTAGLYMDQSLNTPKQKYCSSQSFLASCTPAMWPIMLSHDMIPAQILTHKAIIRTRFLLHDVWRIFDEKKVLRMCKDCLLLPILESYIDIFSSVNVRNAK